MLYLQLQRSTESPQLKTQRLQIQAHKKEPVADVAAATDVDEVEDKVQAVHCLMNTAYAAASIGGHPAGI